MHKFHRIPHMPFSLQVHRDDKIHSDPEIFVNKLVVITEKLDGSCTSLHDGETFSKSGDKACGKWFSVIKANYATKTCFSKRTFFGETMYAKHSIFYDKLSEWFYLFAIMNEDGIILDWKDIANNGIFKTVPVLFVGTFDSIYDIENFMMAEIENPSAFGNEREGFVIRLAHKFHINDAETCVAKFVRKDHVQTDIHWTKTWIPNKLA